MGQTKRTVPGLAKRGDVWHIDKRIGGRRVCESTGETNLQKAEQYLAKKIEDTRKALIFGERPRRTFRWAATKYLEENESKRSIMDDALHLKQLDPFVGDLEIRNVHMGTLRPFIDKRLSDGIKTKSVNLALGVVRHILNVAASDWIDENGLTWLASPPKIKLLPVTDARKPYPMTWDEQARLFQQLPDHLASMAIFKVNTGCREQEVCGLRWDWEIEVPEIGSSVFLIPGDRVKNGEDRLVVLNRIARSVVKDRRGQHPVYVFSYAGRRLRKMNNSGWRRARECAGLSQVRVHDLKHTFGRRLRAARVSFEDRQDLLGHRSRRITSHYSEAELMNLIDAANRVVGDNSRKTPALVLLKKKTASA